MLSIISLNKQTKTKKIKKKKGHLSTKTGELRDLVKYISEGWSLSVIFSCEISSKKSKLQSTLSCWKVKGKHAVCCYKRSYVPSVFNQDEASQKIMQTAQLKNKRKQE